MSHVGRHQRSFRSALGFPSRSAACAPLATTGEFPRSCSSTSDALSSSRFPQVSRPRLQSLAQDISAVRLFQSPGHAHPSSAVLLSSHGSSKQISCSSYSSVWKRSSSSTTASAGRGDSQTIELWEEYFVDPSQWWDNRSLKRNPRSPDFKHKVTGKALWIDGWYTPAWVKAKFKSVAEVRLESGATYITQDTGQGKRQPEGNNRKLNTVPNSARALGQIVQGGGGSLHVLSATVLSEAIAALKNQLQQGFVINSYMYVEVLKQCLKQKDLVAAKQVHDCILKSGMEQNTYVVNNLLRVYIGCGRLQEARCVFNALLKKDVFSWNIMIRGYAQHNRADDAMGLFHEMCHEGVQRDKFTYLIILKVCASSSALNWGKEVHANVRQDGLESDVRVGTALLKMYAKCGCNKEARHIFDNLTNRDLISWNVMIGACADSGCVEEAYQLFLQMKREGFKPDAITYMSLLNVSASAGALDWVKEVHKHVVKSGLELDLRVGNALMHMYAKSGSIDDARAVFDRMKERDAITWNVMIGGLAACGYGQDAYELFLQMRREGCEPNAVTYLSILNACASAGALDWVKEVHKHVVKAGLELDLRVGNALVHMYAKSGSIDDARVVFDRMKERDVITWNMMIGGLAACGYGQDAYELILQMQREGCQPDVITYSSILNGCASAGALDWVKEIHKHVVKSGLELDLRVGNALVHIYAKSGSIDDARAVFDRMKKRDVITWNVMIGGLAARGYGQDAYELFLQMRREGCEPNAVTYLSILNASASAGALDWVKEVHRHVVKAGLELDLRVGNALVHMYAKSGSIDDARAVFDRMKERDVITWNVMIDGLAGHGYGQDAYELFLQMQREGCQPDVITYSSILNASASVGALDWVKEVHKHVVKAGLELDLRVGNALVRMYAKSGSIDDARAVFDRMKDRDVVTWNVMIGGLAACGYGQDAYELFLQMQRERCEPDATTYLSILNASASVGALDWVKEVHKHAVKAELELDLRVGNALVHMYAKSGSIDDARAVFDKMKERDVITWNVMIGGLAACGYGEDAYELFLQMQREGCEPDATTYLSILNGCASGGALDWIKEVHRHVFKAGLELDLHVGSALVHMYAKSGSIDDAKAVFDRMKERDVITWNVMIGGLAACGYGQDAYELFLQMQREGCQPDVITYSSILNASASVGALDWVKEVHRHVVKAGLELDLRVGNALVHMYAKSGSIDDARAVFDRMKERDVVTWNVMIGGLAAHGYGQDAYELLLQMQREGCEPDATTYLSILNASASASAGALDWVKEVHRHVVKAGLELDLRVGNALVHMYAKSGSIDDARVVFDRMKERDVITWNVMIGGLAAHGYGQDAYELILQMQREGCQPDVITYSSILNASASVGALDWVKEVHRHVVKAGLELDLRVGNALVHMYAKSGSIDDARAVFDRMKERDVVTWNVMIGGLGQHGSGLEALSLFREMNADGVKPDVYTFVAVLSACSHSGLVDEGSSLYSAMTQDYGMEPNVFHCNCMVDLLGRAGRLEEAKLFISNMAVEPDEATWGALLGACRNHGNVELGEFAAKKLLNLDAQSAAAYVLLSNIYAEAGRWDKVSSVRTMMHERGVRKTPGRSWIEVDNKIHNFVVADFSHIECMEIYDRKDRVIEKIKAEGYIPDTRLVLKNIDEEDKEHDICSHSEKLAIVYGLMHAPPGKPIRVFKNLRVCKDCHTATKFIAKVEGREIIVRDANRFHHFKDGVCSCGDYW